MSKKHKIVCKALNYFEQFLICNSTVRGSNSISAFALLIEARIGITSFALILKVGGITAGIRKYKSVINKKRKQHDHIVLLAKNKLSLIEVLIAKVLINLYINYEELISVNNVLREYNEINEEIKNHETSVECTI